METNGDGGRFWIGTVARIYELGQLGVSVVEIDKTLHREERQTSTGTVAGTLMTGRLGEVR
jgi:hypothetical protein